MQKTKELNNIIKSVHNKNKWWSTEEVDYLKTLKKAGIYVSTICGNKKLMAEFFPERTYSSIDTKYRKI